MRIHTGGYCHGVNWSTLGFILEEHPVFTDVNALLNTTMNKITTAWSNDSDIFTVDKKADIAHTIKPNSDTPFTPFDIPLIITTSTVSARNEKGETIKANAVVVAIPQKFYHIGNFLMDHLTIVRQTVTHYIPNGFKREDPEGHFEFVAQHRTWLDNHRNIPILNVNSNDQYTKEKNEHQISLKVLLMSVPGIERCNYDSVNKRVNVSVTAANFTTVSKTIVSTLATSGLPFQPMVKQNYNPTGSLGSKKTGTSKYLDMVSKYKKNRSPNSSIATSAENQSHQSTRSTRTWNTNRIPTEIDFTEDNFPPIAHQADKTITPTTSRFNVATPTNYLEAATGNKIGTAPGGGNNSPFKPVSRQATSPFTMDQTESSLTIQSAISQALEAAREDHMRMITMQQAAHRKEIETLTLTFQTQMKMFERNLQHGVNHPERMEYLEDKMERTSNQMDARLDKIIDLLLLRQETNSIIGPSPFRKKTRHETNEASNMEVDHFDQLSSLETQETGAGEIPRTTFTPDSPIRDKVQKTTSPHVSTAIPNQKSITETPPPLPDSPTQNEDSTWLKRQANASSAFTEKAKTLLNPYRTAHETLKEQTKAKHKSSLNAQSTPMSVHLTTLTSSRSDIASRGRED